MDRQRNERYTIVVHPPAGGEQFSLIVPFHSSSSIADLVTEIRDRISATEVFPATTEVVLRLSGENGPILDGRDSLIDVVLSPASELISATLRTTRSKQNISHAPIPPHNTSKDGNFKIRVITPVIARSYDDHRKVPTIRATFTSSTTLREIKSLIAKHLCLEVSDDIPGGNECNCSLARQVSERASRTDDPTGNGDYVWNSQSNKIIVISGFNNVQILKVDGLSQSRILDQVRAELGDEFGSRAFAFIGGKLGSDNNYTKLPVVSVCSVSRHSETGQASSGSRSKASLLDLHTSEAPIELTSSNADLNIGHVGFSELAINGVVNIYVVERKSTNGRMEKKTGKDAIFLDHESWEHPVTQSDRGMAMMLSSLRQFTGLISARQMGQGSQDAVLHLFSLLTRFPPATRAIHILMNGKSPRPSERAALSQALYEVLKDVVPSQLIGSDPKRYMEGARLLFGLILEKVKFLKLEEDAEMPYLSSLKMFDLRNHFTMETIVDAVQTPFGLVERGYYEAFKQDGSLCWKTGDLPLSKLPLKERTRRLSLLCGGAADQVSYFDLDSLNSITGYSGKLNLEDVISSREMMDLVHLSALCSRNKLSVLPPASLPSSDAPALTLDRRGLLAVYVGRASCAEPGKDISIFRPTAGGEEAVDVSIITQLLVPILEERESEGTTIFDAFGDGVRKFKAPDEILMVVVDCSKSMDQKSDFREIETLDAEMLDHIDIEESDDLGTDTSDTEEEKEVGLDEMKAWITEHESVLDIIGAVRGASPRNRAMIAGRLIGLLKGMVSSESAKRIKDLDSYKRTHTSSIYRYHAEQEEPKIAKLKDYNTGLIRHREAICDFLIYRAVNSPMLDEPWTWKVGDPIPQTTAGKTKPVYSTMKGYIPSEFLCPISQEVMEDPVLTDDGFTFDRKNIERWFQIKQSSPLTGLALESASLRFNGEVAAKLKAWINGGDLVELAPRGVSVTFISTIGPFTRQVKPDVSYSTLYDIALRGIKGRYQEFDLIKDSVAIPRIDRSAWLQDGAIFHIRISETGKTDTRSSPNRKMCLIKVYKSYQNVLFSYWTPKSTKTTFASVMFRYWRYQLKESPYISLSDLIPWIGMSDHGDGHHRGWTKTSWDPMSTALTPTYATGCLENETLCATAASSIDSDDEYDPSDNSDNESRSTLVLKVYISAPPSLERKETGRNLSRMDVLKNMFDAFVNRMLAYNFQTHMGLVTFSTSANVKQKVTHAVENFRHKVNGMTPMVYIYLSNNESEVEYLPLGYAADFAQGDTALWDALALANDQVQDYAKKFPNAKKRILCISDGNDNKSTQKPGDLSLALLKNNVVVDSFCLGNDSNIDLLTLSYLSGGYKFKPDSLEQAMAICEMEPVLSLLERPAIILPAQTRSHLYDPFLRLAFARSMAIPEVVTADIFPKRKEHPNTGDEFVQLSSIVATNSPGGPVNSHTDSNLRTSRILTEIRNIVANPHPHYDIYVSESNMAFWKVIMQGPPGSAYSTGTFVLYIHMEDDYPAFPPKCRFITPIYHPNINKHGKVCHSILDRNWTSDTTNLQLVNTIYSLLLVPEFSDPINAVVTLNFHWDEVAFQDAAKEHIKKHATKTRAEWKSEILGEEI